MCWLIIMIFPKPPHPLVLHYGVRYYVEDYRQLHNAVALEMYYQQSRKSIREGDIGCSVDSVCNLTACVMQAHFGNFTDEEKAMKIARAGCYPRAATR